MSKSIILWGITAIVLVGVAGFAAWVLSLPSAPAAAEAPPVPQEETDAMRAALRHEGDGRPVIAVIGLNDATETNDYVTTTGILRRADIADVVMLATEEGPVQLYPALRVEPDATIATFDAEHPEGADYVIVPAMSRDDDPAVMAWLQDQSRKGATIVGVCAGAKVVAAAGLLDGKRATTHWYYLGEMLKRNPTIEYVADRRMVADGNIVTTTGITAAIPMMLALIEAIAGPKKAEVIARDLGVGTWDMRHASAAFNLTRPFATTVLANRMAFWNRDTWGIAFQPGVDEVSLAMIADAWSRTYRSNAVTFAQFSSAIVTANGVRILPDRVDDGWPETASLRPFPISGPRRHWTGRLVASPTAMARQRPTSSPCSSNIRGDSRSRKVPAACREAKVSCVLGTASATEQAKKEQQTWQERPQSLSLA